jgi:hypothetical protein
MNYHATSNRLLPFELPLRDALRIYWQRLILFFKVAVIAGAICITIALVAAGRANAVAAQYAVLASSALALAMGWLIVRAYRRTISQLRANLYAQLRYQRLLIRFISKATSDQNSVSEWARAVTEYQKETLALLASYRESSSILGAEVRRANEQLATFKQALESLRLHGITASTQQIASQIASGVLKLREGGAIAPSQEYMSFVTKPWEHSEITSGAEQLREWFEQIVTLEQVGTTRATLQARLSTLVVSEYVRSLIHEPGFSATRLEAFKSLLRELQEHWRSKHKGY